MVHLVPNKLRNVFVRHLLLPIVGSIFRVLQMLTLLSRKVLELKERILMILLLRDYYCCYLTITVLNDVAQGTTAITRLGRKILMKSVLVQGTLTNSSGQGRILIVYDRQANGVAPAATDVLTSNTIMAIQNLITVTDLSSLLISSPMHRMRHSLLATMEPAPEESWPIRDISSVISKQSMEAMQELLQTSTQALF